MVMPREDPGSIFRRLAARAEFLRRERARGRRGIPTPEELEAERVASARYAVPPEVVQELQQRARQAPVMAPLELARGAAQGLSTVPREVAKSSLLPPRVSQRLQHFFTPPEARSRAGALGQALGQGFADPTMGGEQPLTGSLYEGLMFGLPLPTAGLGPIAVPGTTASAAAGQLARYGATAARVKVPQAARAVTPTLKTMAREQRGGGFGVNKGLLVSRVRRAAARENWEAADTEKLVRAIQEGNLKDLEELQFPESVSDAITDYANQIETSAMQKVSLEQARRRLAPAPLVTKPVVSSETAPALVKPGTTRPPVPTGREAELLAELKRLDRSEALHSSQYARTVPPWATRTSVDYGAPVAANSPAGRSWLKQRANNARYKAIGEELKQLRGQTTRPPVAAGAESAVAKVAPEAAVPTGPARAPQRGEVAEAMAEIQAAVPDVPPADVAVVLRDVYGIGGGAEDIGVPMMYESFRALGKRGDLRSRAAEYLMEQQARRLGMDSSVYTSPVSGLTRRGQTEALQSMADQAQRLDDAVRQQAQKRLAQAEAVTPARAPQPAAPGPRVEPAAATQGIPPQAEVPGQVSVTRGQAPPPVRPPVAQTPPVVVAAAAQPAGPFWLPEPPRATPEYLAAARKGQGWVFRGKKGAFETVEEARQMVLKARDMGQNTVPRVTSYIRQAGDTVKEFGIDPQGVATRVGNPKNRSLAINDVLSNYTHYDLTPKQLEIAKRHGFVYREALKLARSYGVQVNELGGPDEFWQYIARRVKSKLNPLTGEYETPPGAIGGFKMGAKIGAQKERVFDEMAQGLDLGLLYENPDQVMMAHIQGIYRLIGNKQAENMIKPLTRQITEAAPLQFGERAVYEPALRSRAAAVEIANAIDKVFTPEQGWKPLRVAADISGALVGQVAALDVSAPFIQGLLLLGHDLKQALKGRPSAIWAKSYGYMWQAVANPKSINKFREANAPLYKRFIEAGGMTGQSEFVSAVPLVQRGLGKIPVVGKLLREVYKQTWGRMGQAYSDFLEVGKVKFFEQMEPVWQRNGENIYELGAVTNRMAGAVSSAARGVGANQRNLERSLLFAPNYLRASMLLMRDLMSRGATAREVQASLAAFLGAGAAIYYAEEKVRGREPKMKPWPKRLGGDGAEAFTTEAGGARIGMGSWMYGMIKMLSEVGAVAVDDPDSLVVWDDRHPVVRFLKTKQGPAVGLAREMATGRNFFGRKFDSPDDYLMRIAESFIPIAGQSMITQKPRGGIVQAAADIAGLRSFPYSTRSRWTDEEPLFKAYSDIPANDREAKAKGFRLTRDNYLKANPKVDAMVYILGERESLQKKKGAFGGKASDTVARGWVVRLMREYGVKAEDVPGLQEKEYESDDRKNLRLAITRALQALEGQPTPVREATPVPPQGRTQPQPTAAPRQQATPTPAPTMPSWFRPWRDPALEPAGPR